MENSPEKQAQSCTFAVYNGKVVLVEDQAAVTLDLAHQPEMVIDSKYKILGLIGEGGMGAVYKAHHLLLQKDMALKTFRSHNLSPEVWQRFQREAQSIAKLKHKNIVEVFDFGVSEGKLPYYTMSLLTGESLAERLKRSGKIDITEALRLFMQVAEALDHAHRHSIVHRDIKPGNIFLEEHREGKVTLPQVKIVDFGVAKLAEEIPSSANQSITQVGAIFGSPLYMSPEQAIGQDVDHRSDIYSYGCALFETLTGQPPFVGENALATMLCHQTASPPRLPHLLPDVDVPQRLESMMARLLAKKPESRYQTFQEVIHDLQYCLESKDRKQTGAAVAGGIAAEDKRSDDSIGGRQAENFVADENGKKRAVPSTWLPKIVTGVCLFATIVVAGLFLSPQPKQKRLPPAPRSDAGPAIVPDLPDFEIDRHKKERDKAAADKTPFLVGHDSKGAAIFVFPTYASMGFFTKGDEGSRTDSLGKVVVPAQPQLVFHATDEFGRDSSLFLRFKDGDFYGLHLESGTSSDWTIKSFDYIYHLKSLRRIDLNNTPFTGAVLPCLERFPNLNVLVISTTDIDGQDLANSKLISRLDALEVNRLRGLRKFFVEAAKPSSHCHIESITANTCDFSNDDIAAAVKLKSLKTLNIKLGKFDTTGIITLSQKSNLEGMDLTSNKIKDQDLEYLARLKNLRHIAIDRNDLSPAAMTKFRKSLPLCSVSFVTGKDPLNE